MSELITFILGTLFGVALITWVFIIEAVSEDIKSNKRNGVPMDLLGRPKKAQIVKKKEDIDIIFSEEE